MSCKSETITGIEVFAGGGGLALGLEKAGVNTVAVVEFDHEACETLRHNRPKWNVIEADIHNVDFTKYKNQVDLVSGGAPCQAFSYAGKKLGFGDTRGTLFSEFARCVKEVNPKMFLFENVRGLLSHDNGRTFATIKHTFEDLGYAVQYKILNACYYGVGQKRERIIVIGIRNDMLGIISFSYPKPDETWTTLKDALKNCPKSEGQRFSEISGKSWNWFLLEVVGLICLKLLRKNIWEKAIILVVDAEEWQGASHGMNHA